MRRIIAFGIILAAVLSFAQKSGPTPRAPLNKATEAQDTLPPSKARIAFDSERFDFGFTPQGNAYLVHYFEMTNTGGDTLHIDRVRSTCGCTAAPLKSKNIAPNQKTEVGAIFRMRGYKRATSKAVKVESNDPTRKLVSLKFTANLDTTDWHDTTKGPRIFSSPEILDMGKGDLFLSKSEAKIQNASDKKLKLEIVDYTDDIISDVKIKKDTLKPGKETDIEMAIRGDYNSTQPIKASITIAALDESGSEATRITIPISGGGK